MRASTTPLHCVLWDKIQSDTDGAHSALNCSTSWVWLKRQCGHLSTEWLVVQFLTYHIHMSVCPWSRYTLMNTLYRSCLYDREKHYIGWNTVKNKKCFVEVWMGLCSCSVKHWMVIKIRKAPYECSVMLPRNQLWFFAYIFHYCCYHLCC